MFFYIITDRKIEKVNAPPSQPSIAVSLTKAGRGIKSDKKLELR